MSSNESSDERELKKMKKISGATTFQRTRSLLQPKQTSPPTTNIGDMWKVPRAQIGRIFRSTFPSIYPHLNWELKRMS